MPVPRQQIASLAYVNFSHKKIVCCVSNLYLLPISIKIVFYSTINYNSEASIHKYYSKFLYFNKKNTTH